MAIQRQAENPAESLIIDEPFRYSIKPSKKKTSAPIRSTTPSQPIESVKKDIVYTLAVFGVILTVLIGLYFKMR